MSAAAEVPQTDEMTVDLALVEAKPCAPESTHEGTTLGVEGVLPCRRAVRCAQQRDQARLGHRNAAAAQAEAIQQTNQLPRSP